MGEILKSFKVIALTQKGRDSIKKNYLERARMKPLEKLLFNKLFTVIVLPDFSSIEFRGRTLATNYVDSESMVKTMSDSMKSDGCVENKDFKTEVSFFE